VNDQARFLYYTNKSLNRKVIFKPDYTAATNLKVTVISLDEENRRIEIYGLDSPYWTATGVTSEASGFGLRQYVAIK
jgi:hypothetical protein